MALLLNSPPAEGEPAIHALVVAIGDYPYLEGGGAEPLIDTAGMGQLSSPPVSAVGICDWLLHSFSPAQGKLSSLEVVCSGAANFKDKQGNPVAVERATLNHVRQAIKRWNALVSASKQNIALFYFCGHGVTSGGVHSLLLEDFGSDDDDPFNTGAIDANGFVDGMRKSGALRQLFLFDACRSAPETYLREYGTQRGQPIINAGQSVALGELNQVVWWASELGRPAFGRKNSPTVFLEAFLSTVRGASAVRDLDTDEWLIQANKLAEGMNAYITRIVGGDKQFVTPGRLSYGFPLHALAGDPVVPVQVACKPKSRAIEVTLRCSSGDERAAGHKGTWHFELPFGNYVVAAHEGVNGTLLDQQPCPANPPLTSVIVRV